MEMKMQKHSVSYDDISLRRGSSDTKAVSKETAVSVEKAKNAAEESATQEAGFKHKARTAGVAAMAVGATGMIVGGVALVFAPLAGVAALTLGWYFMQRGAIIYATNK